MSCMHLPSFTIYICIFNIFHILWLSFATRYPIIHPAPCNADQYPQCLRDTSLVLCCSSSLPFRRENRGKSREVEIDVSCFQPNPSRYIYITVLVFTRWHLPSSSFVHFRVDSWELDHPGRLLHTSRSASNMLSFDIPRSVDNWDDRPIQIAFTNWI